MWLHLNEPFDCRNIIYNRRKWCLFCWGSNSIIIPGSSRKFINCALNIKWPRRKRFTREKSKNQIEIYIIKRISAVELSSNWQTQRFASQRGFVVSQPLDECALVHRSLLAVAFFFLRLTRDINFIRHSVNSNSLTGTDIRKLNITFVFRSTLFARLWFLLISVGIFYQFILLLIISAKKKKKQRGLFSVSCTLFSHVPFLFNVFSFPNKYWQLKQRFITIKSTKRWKLNHQR